MGSNDKHKKDGRGGSRKHPADCKCGACPKLGRPPVVRATDAGVATRVLAKKRAETLWCSLIELECDRLGIGEDGKRIPPPKPKKKPKGDDVIDGPDFRGRFSILPLTNLLRYLEDRAYGRPMDTVNHLHNKPIDHNVTLSLGEGMRIAMEKAEKRVKHRSR